METPTRLTACGLRRFDSEGQERLLETCQKLWDEGVHVVVSNSGVMYDFYEEAGFHVGIEGATRSINSDADNRGEADEIIATSVPPEDRVSGRTDVVGRSRCVGRRATLTEFESRRTGTQGRD